jgi:hypothetical protein
MLVRNPLQFEPLLKQPKIKTTMRIWTFANGEKTVSLVTLQILISTEGIYQ